MTLKLKMLKPAIWAGNGMGTNAAEWTLAADPGWRIFKSGGSWRAHHTDGRQLIEFFGGRANILAQLERELAK